MTVKPTVIKRRREEIDAPPVPLQNPVKGKCLPAQSAAISFAIVKTMWRKDFGIIKKGRFRCVKD